MAGYKRVIIYLEEGECPAKTVGYVRLEQKESGMQMSLSLTECVMPERSPVCLLYREAGQIDSVTIGELADGVTAEGKMLPGELPDIALLENMIGVIVGTAERYLAGRGKDSEPLPTYDMLLEKQEAKQKKETVLEASEMQETALQTWGEEMYPFEDDQMHWCRQIMPEDLSHLPMKHWSLAGNSFLMQGYYHYRHLILCETVNGVAYVGVPGQYHRRECYLAGKFGFSLFKPTLKKQLVIGDFGYWLFEL